MESFGDNTQMTDDNRPQPYSLRLEPETRAKIEAIAKANGRSLNAQIVLMLDEWLSGTNGHEQPVTESRVIELIRAELTKAGK
jgi:hypothetical protein